MFPAQPLDSTDPVSLDGETYTLELEHRNLTVARLRRGKETVVEEFAIQSPKDTYSVGRGEEVALGRLAKDYDFRVSPAPVGTKERLREILTQIRGKASDLSIYLTPHPVEVGSLAPGSPVVRSEDREVGETTSWFPRFVVGDRVRTNRNFEHSPEINKSGTIVEIVHYARNSWAIVRFDSDPKGMPWALRPSDIDPLVFRVGDRVRYNIEKEDDGLYWNKDLIVTNVFSPDKIGAVTDNGKGLPGVFQSEWLELE